MYELLVTHINQSLNTSIDATSLEELRKKLSAYINQLINTDFEKLISLLYRIDVNETKLRCLLDASEGRNAAQLIADLIIERQLQKIESRKNSKPEDDIPEDERW